MNSITNIGLDIAKDVFHVFATNREGIPVISRKLKRGDVMPFMAKVPPCTIGIEACNTGHHWARALSALGHTVKLIHPHYVKSFVKRGKSDAIDAEAINEAVSRRGMRFVPMKSVDQQATTMIFRARTLLVRQRIQASNALRNHLSELGIIANAGMHNVKILVAIVRDREKHGLPKAALVALDIIVHQIENLAAQIHALDREILRLARADEDMRRLMTIPGVGPVTAAAVRTAVVDPKAFKSAKHFAAWLGLTPKISSSGGTTVLGRISKMGDGTLRSLLVSGATSAIRIAKGDEQTGRWLLRLKERKPFKVVAVALANKMARIIWALLVKGGIYNKSPFAGLASA